MGRDFSPVQTGPGAQPAPCTMGTVPFPGVKYGRGVMLTTHPLLVPWSWKGRAIPLPNLWATTRLVTGTLYFTLQSLNNSSSCLIIRLKFECSLLTVLIFSAFPTGCSACHLAAQSRITDPLWLLLTKPFEVPVYSKSFKNTVTTSQKTFRFHFKDQLINPYPTAFPYGNGMVLHFYQQQESSTTKTVHKSLTRDLKLMYSRLTLVRIAINL